MFTKNRRAFTIIEIGIILIILVVIAMLAIPQFNRQRAVTNQVKANMVSESGSVSFPEKFAPLPDIRTDHWFTPGVVYKVLDVQMLNHERTLGVANVGDTDGHMFLTVRPEVIALKRGQKFKFEAGPDGLNTGKLIEVTMRYCDEPLFGP